MVVLGIVAGLAATAEKNDDYIESNEQLDKCVRFDVLEDSTIGVKSGEHLGRASDAGPAVQAVQKIVEIHRFSINGADDPEDRGDFSQVQFLDKVVEMLVVVQHQVSTVQVVQKTVGHEAERQHGSFSPTCSMSTNPVRSRIVQQCQSRTLGKRRGVREAHGV